MVKSVIKNLIKTQKLVSVDKIRVDRENPRYHDKLILKNKHRWTENQITSEIQKDNLQDISESIKEHGVLDPIWIVESDDDDDMYDVIEGSRRLVVLKTLLNNKIIPPTGIRYDVVMSNILDKSTPDELLVAQRVILQTGKKTWGPYNTASVIYSLYQRRFTTADIAKLLGKRISTIDKELYHYTLYEEYVEYLKNKDKPADPKRYTYFQRAGNSVRDKLFSNESGKKKFFKLITPPKKGVKARISSVSLEGGLMHFNTIAQDDQILNCFLNDTSMTVQMAMAQYKGIHIIAEFPWTKDLINISEEIQGLEPSSIRKFKRDQNFMNDLKTIYKFCKKILES